MSPTPSNPPPARRAAMAFIFVTVLLDMLAFGIIIPVTPHLIEQLSGGGIADAAWWVGVFSAVFALVQFVATPVQGALSDHYGRRPVILISNLGLALDFMVLALAPTLWLLFVGRVVLGMTAASFSTANAYIADVVPAEKRAAAFGLLGGAFGIGFIIGPGLGGWLGEINLRLPFWIAAGLALCNFLYGWLILPESLPKQRRSPRFELRHANPLASLTLLRRHPQLLSLALVMFLVYLAHYVLQTVFVLYADYRYDWGPRAVGQVLMLTGICDGLAQAVLTGKLTGRFGERRVLLAGLLFGVGAFLVMGLSSVGSVFLLGLPLMALWGMSNPPTQALMTHRIDASEQGRLQGAIGSLASVAGIGGPFLFAQVFAYSIRPGTGMHLPGLAFLLAAVLLAIALLIAWRATRGEPTHLRDLASARPLPGALPGEIPPIANHPLPETAEHPP